MSEGQTGEERRLELGAAFREGGVTYDALRPAYPREAVAWGAGDVPADVVDVGAGTGKLTGVLLGLGHRVTAVDPSEDMLAVLRSSSPDVEVRVGTGEETGLPQGCCDVVTYGAAWHWTDPAVAGAEAHRIVRPGGRLVLLWNLMDLQVPWVAGLNQVMHSMDSGYDTRSGSAARVPGELFGEPDVQESRWSRPMTTRALVDQVTTRSYYLALPLEQRPELVRRVHEYVEAWHGGVDHRIVETPYVTQVYRFVRR